MTRKQIFAVAVKEVDLWGPRIPRGIVIAILFCFAHRLATGETFEESFLKPGEPVIDYQI